MDTNINSYRDEKYKLNESPHQSAIISNDSSWGEKLKNYQKARNKPFFNNNDFPKIITRKQIMSTEGKFNPILQKYTDP